VEAIKSGGGLDVESVAKKVINFEADKASMLQGAQSIVTQQVKEKYLSFVIGVHCVAHRCYLAYKALSNLGIFSEIEKLLSVVYAYFSKSPKWFSKFRQLAEFTQTKGLKILRNVQTWWVSLIEPLHGFLSEYRTLIYKMNTDLNDNNKAEVCFPNSMFSFSLYLCCFVSFCLSLCCFVFVVYTFVLFTVISWTHGLLLCLRY